MRHGKGTWCEPPHMLLPTRFGSQTRDPSAVMPDPSAELAPIDSVRATYHRLLRLCSERQRCLVGEADHLRHASRPKKEVCLRSASSLPLHEALKRNPAFNNTASLLLPAPTDGDAGLDPMKEDLVARLAQLDEAIASLQAIAAAQHGDTQATAAPPGPNALELSALAAADAELRFQLRAGASCTPQPIAPFSVGREGAASGPMGLGGVGVPASSTAANDSEPTGSSMLRPFLPENVRKRLREPVLVPAKHEEQRQNGNTTGSATGTGGAVAPLLMRTPCGALGVVPSPQLQRGDVVHVPFTAAEAAILRAALSRHGYTQRQPSLQKPLEQQQQQPPSVEDPSAREERMLRQWAAESDAPEGSAGGSACLRGEAACEIPLRVMQEVSALLPGRSAGDCLRFWQSTESTESTPAVADSTPTSSLSAVEPPQGHDGQMWLVRATHRAPSPTPPPFDPTAARNRSTATSVPPLEPHIALNASLQHNWFTSLRALARRCHWP
jgi:hypothetical protein